MKETYYFSHDGNARNDEKILMLRAEYGWEGYGIFWVLIEMMFESTDTSLSHAKLKGIAVSHNIDITLLQSVINTCITEALFISNGDQFWSESLRKRKNKFQEIKAQKSEAGKKGMAKRWGSDNTDITPLKQSDNADITEDNKVKEIKEKKNIIITLDEEKFFKECCGLYPNSKGQTSGSKKKEIYKLGESFKKCISLYLADIKAERENGFPTKQYKNRSTFFNSGYMDYLEEATKKPDPKPDRPLAGTLKFEIQESAPKPVEEDTEIPF